ncbi:MAG: protein adenylyltransferase SelO family protein [Bdellovibrionales bacterium]
MSLKTAAKSLRPNDLELQYRKFDSIDGEHPWLKAVPEGAVTYRVRELNQGTVVYFNYFLAKEMGLIPENHSHQMTPLLHQKIIQTFSLQIINEYDELSKKRFKEEHIKPNRYMATRYLQLQHSNKQGKTSGDGRGIWNGTVNHRGQVWDVSSRGTGVTCLAPGSVEAQRPLKTGAAEFGYGCGLAEIDELLGAAIMAEAFHLQGLSTERVLCIIDLGKGVGIGVRASHNLIRPAHLFRLLKLEQHENLKSALDYLIERQIQNKRWLFSNKHNLYDQLLTKISHSFAQFTAQLDVDYIFAWLDWDGDNVLIDAGIIDYGSVRQFGSRHDRYRYDDVERFSTNLNEQRNKAKLIVQVFAQLIDYAKTGHKKPLKNFSKHSIIQEFNKIFINSKRERFLYRIGFDSEQRKKLLSRTSLISDFETLFSYFERAKISGSPQKVSDGINHPPLFNMRTFLREMPGRLMQESFINEEELFKNCLSSFVSQRHYKMGKKHQKKLNHLIRLYQALVLTAGCGQKKVTLQKLKSRSEILNSEKRITGNALINIVNLILEEKKKGLSATGIQKVIDKLVLEHLDYPEVQLSRNYKKEIRKPTIPADINRQLLKLVLAFKDDI